MVNLFFNKKAGFHIVHPKCTAPKQCKSMFKLLVNSDHVFCLPLSSTLCNNSSTSSMLVNSNNNSHLNNSSTYPSPSSSDDF